MQSAILKIKKNLKKDASYLKIAWHSKRQKKNIEKWERKTKNEKKSNSNNNFFFFTFKFSYRKIYVFLEKLFEKLILYNVRPPFCWVRMSQKFCLGDDYFRFHRGESYILGEVFAWGTSDFSSTFLFLWFCDLLLRINK